APRSNLRPVRSPLTPGRPVGAISAINATARDRSPAQLVRAALPTAAAAPEAGRPKTGNAGVPHLPRKVRPRCPLHVALRLSRHVRQLRSRRCFGILHTAFLAAANRLGSRICEFSVQRDHIHLVVETQDATTLARSMQGLAIRVAKGLNKLMAARGAVFADRYHARSLRTPSEVRGALAYVLGNARKHLGRYGERFSPGWLDPFSSAPWFGGWEELPPTPAEPA